MPQSYRSGLTLKNSLLAAALYAVLALIVFYATAASMVAIWSRSDTFAHGYLILPISLWLVWNQRDYLATVTPQPAAWIGLLILPVGAVWLLAWLVDVLVVQQLALVTILIVGVWAILGHRLAWALAFPLLFLFFAVPMGEGLIAPMMDFTAYSTVWLVQQSGIPVFREGLYFTLPTGRWSVVEACSGVRYIIASVTVGALFAYLTYVSWWRRALFILVSIIVPILANTLRAYMIVMLGHHSDMRIATGADHLVYGWVFFGVVIFVLFWIGSFFREEPLSPAETAARRPVRAPQAMSNGAILPAFLLAVVAASAAPLLASRLDVGPVNISYGVQELPVPANGWARTDASALSWEPFASVAGSVHAAYAQDDDSVFVELQYWAGQQDPGEVVGSAARFARQDGDWRVIARAAPVIAIGARQTAVQEARLRGPEGELVAWSWYLLGQRQTANDYVGKLLEAASVLGAAPPGAVRIVLYAQAYSDVDTVRERLQAFVNDHGEALVAKLRARHLAYQP
jgi:exosortase A